MNDNKQSALYHRNVNEKTLCNGLFQQIRQSGAFLMHFQQNYWPVSSKSSVQNTASVLLSYSVSVCIAINCKVHVFNDLTELSQQGQTLSQKTFGHSTGVINKMNEFSLVPLDSSSDSPIPLILINVSTLILGLNRASINVTQSPE